MKQSAGPREINFFWEAGKINFRQAIAFNFRNAHCTASWGSANGGIDGKAGKGTA